MKYNAKNSTLHSTTCSATCYLLQNMPLLFATEFCFYSHEIEILNVSRWIYTQLHCIIQVYLADWISERGFDQFQLWESPLTVGSSHNNAEKSTNYVRYILEIAVDFQYSSHRSACCLVHHCLLLIHWPTPPGCPPRVHHSVQLVSKFKRIIN